MDVTLQRHCAKYIYVIPEGLRELMSDISREVLRSQPENLYTFIADYLDALLITRENARVAAKFVESLTEVGVTITELLVRTGMTREEANKVAAVIQVAFRKHLAERKALKEKLASEAVEEANIVTEVLDEAKIDPERAEEAALIIQAAYRAFKQRQEREKDLLRGMVDWRIAARSTMRLYRKTGVTYEEANRAATLIKAAYKGYYTRRVMRRLLAEANVSFEDEEDKEGEEGEEERIPIFEKLALSWDEEEQEEESIYAETKETDVSEKISEGSQEIVADVLQTLIKRVIPSTTSFTDTQIDISSSLPAEAVDEVQGEPTKHETTQITPEDLPTEEVPLPTDVEEQPIQREGETVTEEAGTTVQPTSDEVPIETDVQDTNRTDNTETVTETTDIPDTTTETDIENPET